MPKKYMNEIPTIVKEAKILELSSNKIMDIYKNLEANGKDFNIQEQLVHKNCLVLMGNRYRFNELKKEAILI
ncbi:hypothetical protein CRV08_02245 [Halarcobacter ebronensis]|uniref:Uncharacterized protein n=2 Tax=Halarcobacter ebronensis TaxID=1462615 RepID=A0A4Q0YH08_9BACT|nr:hypothetical protein CRV08_02245 [Halarcobacter ebronensis]